MPMLYQLPLCTVVKSNHADAKSGQVTTKKAIQFYSKCDSFPLNLSYAEVFFKDCIPDHLHQLHAFPTGHIRSAAG